MEKFYSYLNMGNISIFNGSVEVLMNDEGTPSPDIHSDSVTYVYMVFFLPLCTGIVAVIVFTAHALMVKKSKKKV